MTIEGFWRAAPRDPERVVLVEPDGREIRAGDLFAAGNRLVAGLRELGLGRGDTLVAALPNEATVFELLLAAFQAGWNLSLLNTHLTAPEMAFILADSGAKAFVAHERFGAVAAAAADEAGLAARGRFAVGTIPSAVGTIPGFAPYASLGRGHSPELPAERTAGQLLQYTSGTTGRPKAVRRPLPPLDPDTAISLYAQHLLRFDIEPGGAGVHLCGSPMYHLAALAYAWFSLHLDHRVVLLDRWSPEAALSTIERQRVTTTHMVPTQFHRLLQLPREVRERFDLSSLRNVLHAAAPCPVETKRRMLEWWGPVIYEYYGASEGGGTLVKPDEWLRKPGTVGRAWQGAEIRILDDAGQPCPPGELGTVYLKLLADFEYGGDPKKTRENRIGDFFTVGDVGYLDADGYLFLRDRKIDMIISGGVNVYPAEVEAALLSHPAVGDAAVFGIPDDDWGEQVKAVVEPAAGAAPGPALERALIEHCRERLAGFKCPRSVDFVDALPRDPNGKLYKRKLRDPWWQGRERAI